jgi:very-short-patch-repair endonuclease
MEAFMRNQATKGVMGGAMRLRVLGYTVARFSNGIVLNAPEEFVKRVVALVNQGT